MQFIITDAWKQTWSGASVGVLALHNTSNPQTCAALEAVKAEIEQDLRDRFGEGGRPAIRALPLMQAYKAYYKRFKKTYHVEQQVESIALKRRSLPHVAALVEAMFAAEVKNMLLTAGHDLDLTQGPLTLTAATGSEVYTGISGREITCKATDMIISDSVGVLSAIIYGPDKRTAINPKTSSAVFTVYAPAGVDPGAVQAHLNDIRDYARLITPQTEVVHNAIYSA